MPAPAPLPTVPRPRFTKLPGRLPRFRLRLGVPTGSSLWLGADCLMQTRLTFCQESYNRFDYKDIQALLVRKTPRGAIFTAILGVLSALLLWVTLSVGFDNGQVFYAIMATVFIALLIYNAVRGATCRCVLYTALGSKPLPTLNRMRPTLRAVGLITERVEAVQGALSPEAAADRMSDYLDEKNRETQQPQPGSGFADPAPRPVV